uniref:Deoxynucleoside kinase domain-containing protein n=1 Tax=viral metagenome TaxID=1070528 RepID=A0A6C0C4Z0_9ZZZZ
MTYIFSVEGNIGSGKSTLLKELKNKLTQIQHYDIIYLQEPVNIWESFKDENGKSIIESFYENNKKFAFSFQMMAYISRLNQLKTTLKNNMNKNVIIITERSIHTDKEVFAKMLHDQKNMNKIEYDIYNKWFDQFLEECIIDGIIYVKTSPSKCLERINKRRRKGESMTIEYLNDCHKYHDNWIENNDEIKHLLLNGNETYGSRNYISWTTHIEKFINDKIKKDYTQSFDYQFFLNHPFC